jgi:hypothetical protein
MEIQKKEYLVIERDKNIFFRSESADDLINILIKNNFSISEISENTMTLENTTNGDNIVCEFGIIEKINIEEFKLPVIALREELVVAFKKITSTGFHMPDDEVKKMQKMFNFLGLKNKK